jgi:glycosyltransferase involved in cell wall biosynthesis
LKRVLIITYYWPPSGGSGVQRWLKFAKYLPDFDWQPVIYTPENPAFDATDQSLIKDVSPQAEVIKTPIWEPYAIYNSLTGGKKKGSQNFGIKQDGKGGSGVLGSLAQWVRGNLLIPDPRKFWIKPSVKYLSKYLSEHPVDVMVTTGPPHSMHLIGRELSKKTGISWVADFRDPWSELDLLEDYKLSPAVQKKYRELEQSVLRQSDVCLTVSSHWGEMFRQLGADKVEVITNGYDQDDFKLKDHRSEKFVISHFGLLNHRRNPSALWKALDSICDEDEAFKSALEIRLGGVIDPEALSEIQSYENLQPRLKLYEYQSHEQVLQHYSESSLLLLLTFDSKSGIGNIPGKLFEYLASAKPVCAFGKVDSDVERILIETGAGRQFQYDQEGSDNLKEYIADLFEKGTESTTGNISEKIRKFERKQLTGDLVTLLNRLS